MTLLDQFYWRYATGFGRMLHGLLIRDRHLWHSDGGYRLVHDAAGVEIWIANRAYGLSVRVGRGLKGDDIQPNWADRKLIWRQIRQMDIPTPEQFRQRRAVEQLRELAAAAPTRPERDYDHAEAIEQKAERFERLIGEYRDA